MSQWLSKFTQKPKAIPDNLDIVISVSRLSVSNSASFPKNKREALLEKTPKTGEYSLLSRGKEEGESEKKKDYKFKKKGISLTDSIDTMEMPSPFLKKWLARCSEKDRVFQHTPKQENSHSFAAEPKDLKSKFLDEVQKILPQETTSDCLQSQNFQSTLPSRQAQGLSYKLMTDAAEAITAIEALIDTNDWIGLDLETTGLYPHEGSKARLLQLAPSKGPVLVIDLFQTKGLEIFKSCLSNLKMVAHNAVFEMKFLKAAGIDITLDCTLLAHHVLNGEMAKLSELCKLHFDIELDKTEQKSNWSGELTESQLLYAAKDAHLTRLLFLKLKAEMENQGCQDVYRLCKEAQKAVVLMELKGMPFDKEAHDILLQKLLAQRETHQQKLELRLGHMNLNSSKQLGEWLTHLLKGEKSQNFLKWPKTPKGNLATSEKDFKKALRLLPQAEQDLMINDFLPYKGIQKQISSFGESLTKFISSATGRIHSSFKMAGTKTGRFSCNHPNLQQIPRDKEFRSLFKAPLGRTFVIADYSQMELRVAAIVGCENKLLQAYKEGVDTHALTAAMLLCKKVDEVTKRERQLAKAVNFGLLYGQGARGLKDYAENSYGVTISEKEAAAYREAWFKAYPKILAWQKKTWNQSARSLFIKTPMGRKRTFTRSKDGDTYSATKAYNTPIQGGAAEVMLAALGKLAEFLVGLDATPLSVIHDEVIVESSIQDAPLALKALEQAMIQGMLEVFPNASPLGLVDAKIADSWAEK